MLPRRAFLRAIAAAPLVAACARKGRGQLLNVSFDPTRELYEEINVAFRKAEGTRGVAPPTVSQSHGGSGKQARAVIDGLKADVVTLALAYDIDALVKGKLVREEWRTRLPRNACPFTSSIVFLVRKGNPKGIRDWDDSAAPGVGVVTPNPKTSGGARWNYLAAWGFELGRSGDEAKAKELVRRIFANVPVLDSGARGATNTFVDRGLGDALIAWESEALLAARDLQKDAVEIVAPPSSILAEPPVAVVDKVVDMKGTRRAAEDYLAFLFEDVAQVIAAKHYYRPTSEAVLSDQGSLFAKIDLFTVDDRFGGWSAAQAKHFSDGGTFDEIYAPK